MKKENKTKEQIAKSKKIKQTVIAASALTAAVAPTATTVFLITKNDLRNGKVKATSEKAAITNAAGLTAGQQDDLNDTISALNRNIQNGKISREDYVYIKSYMSDSRRTAWINAVLATTVQGKLVSTWIEEFEKANQYTGNQSLFSGAGIVKPGASQLATNLGSQQASSIFKPLTALTTDAPNLGLNQLDYQNVENEVRHMLEQLGTAAHMQGSVAQGNAQLNLSSGLQIGSQLQKLNQAIDSYYSINPSSAFKIWYTIGQSTTKHFIHIGDNSFDFSELKNNLVNGQLPDIHFMAGYITPNTPQIDNHGVEFIMKGGSQPAASFSTLQDYHSFVSQSGSQSGTQNGAVTAAHAVGLGKLLSTSQNGRPTLATDAQKEMQSIVNNVAANATYSGNTSETIVDLQSLPTPSSALRNFLNNTTRQEYDDNYKNNLAPKLYYSIGNSSKLIKITHKHFTIMSSESLLSKANGNVLPNIHYYYALSKTDNNGTNSLGVQRDNLGWDSQTSSEKSFDYVGAVGTDVASQSGNTTAKFAKIKDIVKNIADPVIANAQNNATRNVTENIEQGIVNHSPIVKYTYRIHGSNDGWKSAAEFFKDGAKGRTDEVYLGIDWRVEPLNAVIIDGKTTHSANSSFRNLGTSANPNIAAEGTITLARPVITEVLVPKNIGSDDSHYDFTNLTPGLNYQFDLRRPDGTMISWPAGAGGAYANLAQISNWNKQNLLPSLFDDATGKFRTIHYSVGEIFDPSKLDQAIMKARGQEFTSTSNHYINGYIHLTPNDLPDAGHHAKIASFTAPKIDAKSTDTQHIKIELPQFSPMNFEYSLDGNDWTLKLDSNGILVDANGKPVNAWDGAVRKSLQWRVNAANPIKSGLFVDYKGPTDDAHMKGVLSTDALPKFVTNVAIKGSNIKGPSLVSKPNENTMNFDITRDSELQVIFQYSLDGTKWVSRDELLHVVTQNGDLMYSGVFGGQRNLLSGSTVRPILVRTKPVSLLSQADKFVLDATAAQAAGLTLNADGTWHGQIDTSKLPIGIPSQVFEDVKNVPTLTGSTTTNYVLTAPTVAHQTYLFKLETEDDSKWVDATTFKTNHPNIKVQQNGKFIAATLQWKAVPDQGYLFVNSSVKLNGWISASGQFARPQVLIPATALSAQIEHTITAPIIIGTNTANAKVQIKPEQGVIYQYSIDNGTTWKDITSAQQVIPASELVKADGTKNTLQWRVTFAPSHIAASGQTTSGALSTTNLQIAITSLTPPTASMFHGTNTMQWTVESSLFNKPGLDFTFTIGSDTYTLDQLKAKQGQINLFDETQNVMKRITWTASVKAGYDIVGTFAKQGTITNVTLDKYLTVISAPTITSTISSSYNFATLPDSSHVSVKYSVDQTNWMDETAFHAKYSNLFDGTNLIHVYYQIEAKTGYVLDANVIKTAEILLPTNMTKVGGTITNSGVIGTTTADYSLVDKVDHYKFEYSTTASGPWQSAKDFKDAHKNLWTMPGVLTTINYRVVPDAGYQFTGSGVVDVSKLAPVISTSAITAPKWVGKTSKVSTNDITTIDLNKFNGVEFMFSLDANATAQTAMSWNDFIKDIIANHGGNIYDTASGVMLPIYWIPVAKQINGVTPVFDVAPTLKQLQLDASITKVISSLTLPHITSTTNMSDAWAFNVATQNGVTFTIGTSVQKSPADFALLSPNLYDGTVFKPVTWQAHAAMGYQFDTSVSTSGNFDADISKFTKVIDTVHEVTVQSTNPNAYSFAVPTTAGLEYKFVIDGSNETPADYATFTKNHPSLWDATNNVLYKVRWSATALTGYSISSKATATGLIDFAGLNKVIADVKTPVFDQVKTLDSQSWALTAHDAKDVKTQYRVAGTQVWLDEKGLRDYINAHFKDGNLWDESKQAFVEIEWQVTPVDSSSVFEPGFVNTGKIAYTQVTNGQSWTMLKFVQATLPVLSGASTHDFNISNMDPHLDYKFALDGATPSLTWDQLVASLRNKNFYDASTDTMHTLNWTATGKQGYNTRVLSGQTLASTIDINLPKYIDVVNPLTVTGSSTDHYQFNGSTTGVVYKVSTTNNGGFEELSAFIAHHPNLWVNGKSIDVYYQVSSIDTTKYIVDPSKATGKVDLSSLKIALNSFVKPTIDTAHNDSNALQILTLDANVTYQFQISDLDKNWYSAADLIAKWGSQIFNQDLDILHAITYKVSVADATKYVFASSVTTTGMLDLSGIHKVVTSVKTPELIWAASEHRSSDYDFKMETSAVDYYFRVDGGAWVLASQFNKINLWDSSKDSVSTPGAKGEFRTLEWKAEQKQGYGATQTWTGTIDLTQINIRVIDSVSYPLVTNPNGGKVTSVLAEGHTQLTTLGVDYKYADTSKHDDHLMSGTEINALHPNAYDDKTFVLDAFVWGAQAQTGYELSDKVVNRITKQAAESLARALPFDTTDWIKVVNSLNHPILSGMQTNWQITGDDTVAYEYKFRISGTQDSFVSYSDLLAAHPSLFYDHNDHQIEWQAIAKTGYRIDDKITTGIFALLTNDKEITSVNKPNITFTDSHVMTLDASSLSSNVIYGFKLDSDATYMSWDDFRKAHPNLYDAASDSLKDIQWQALPDKARGFDFKSSVTSNDATAVVSPTEIHGTIAVTTVKYIGTIAAPELVDPSADSDKVAFKDFTPHVTYQFQLDGHPIQSNVIIRHIHNFEEWSNFKGVLTWTTSPMPGYAADNVNRSGTIDLSKMTRIIKQDHPLVISLASKSTSDYKLTGGIETMDPKTGLSEISATGINYEVAIYSQDDLNANKAKTWLSLAEINAHPEQHPLFTLDGGKMIVEWRATVQQGYKASTTQQLSETITVPDTLTKILDKFPPIILTGGTTTMDYVFGIDAKYNNIVDYEFSLQNDPSSTEWYTFADFKQHNQNLFDVVKGFNKPVYARPIPGPAARFPKGVIINIQTVDTSMLTSVIDSVAIPKLDASSTSTTNYDVDASQSYLVYTYRVSGSSGQFMDINAFKAAHPNLFHIVNGNVVIEQIEWQATAENTTTTINGKTYPKYVIGKSTVHTGVISTQTLLKVVSVSPAISAEGTSLAPILKGISSDNKQVDLANVIGMHFEFTIGTNKFTSINDLLTFITSHNLYDVASAQLAQINYVAIADAGYELSFTSSGVIDLSKVQKIIDSIDQAWVPVLSASSTQWSYDFVQSQHPSMFVYKYSTDQNAPASQWQTESDFKTSNPTLLDANNQNKQIYYRIEIDPAQASQYAFEASLKHDGIIASTFSQVVSSVTAPTAKDGGTSKNFDFNEPTAHVSYGYSLTQNGPYVPYAQLIGTNLYDSATGMMKDLYWTATVDAGYTFTPGIKTSGKVSLEHAKLTRVIETFNNPVFFANTSIDYGFDGSKTTTGTKFEISVDGADFKSASDLMKAGVNLFDQSTGHVKNLRWRIVPVNSQVASFEIDSQQPKEGVISVPSTMINVVDQVAAPTFIQHDSSKVITSENWDLQEVGAHGYTLEYSFDGLNWMDQQHLKASLTNGNLYAIANDQIKQIQWRAVVENKAMFNPKLQPTDLHGTIVAPTNMIKMIDAVEAPSIKNGQLSNAYSFTLPTQHTNYQFKLSSEDSSKWVDAATFVTNHTNIYNQSTGLIQEIQWQASPETGHDFSSLVSTRSGAFTPNLVKVITSVDALQVNALIKDAETSTNENVPYIVSFETTTGNNPSKVTGVTYLLSDSENGTYQEFDKFIASHPNLYSTTTGLSQVWWKAQAASNEYKLQVAVDHGQINIDSLIKIVETDALEPTFAPGSSTSHWTFNDLTTQNWISSYEFSVDGGKTWVSQQEFESNYSDLNTLKSNNLDVQWRAVFKPGYKESFNSVNEGMLDIQNLLTQFDTSHIDVAGITIKPNATSYEFGNIPSIDQSAGFHLEVSWGDDASHWIKPTDADWPFQSNNPLMDLWDNEHLNSDGSYGQWIHGGSVSFRLAPNVQTDSISDDKHTTIEFEKTLPKLIRNLSIVSTGENHDATNIFIGFDPLVSKSNSIIPNVNALAGHETHNVDYLYNPFVGMSQQDRDLLIDSFNEDFFNKVKDDLKAKGAVFTDFASFKDLWRTEWVSSSMLQALPGLLDGNLYTGSSWKIISIDVKPISKLANANLVNAGTHHIWDASMNTISKVVDNADIIKAAINAIKPALNPLSVNDNVIWGDSQELLDVANQASSKNLIIRIGYASAHIVSQDELNAGNYAGHIVGDLVEPEDGDIAWMTLGEPMRPDDIRKMNEILNPQHSLRRLFVQVVSTERDEALRDLTNTDPNYKPPFVKVTDALVHEITNESEIAKVKTHYILGKTISTGDIVISGLISDPQIDDSQVVQPGLEVVYSTTSDPNNWMDKATFIQYLKDQFVLGNVIAGEDIVAKVQLQDSLKDKYLVTDKLEGSVDFSHLYTLVDIQQYVKALDSIKLEGTPSDSILNLGKTVFISTDANNPLTSDAFKKYFAIQYRINDGEWVMFNPEQTDLEPDWAHNIAKHMAGTWMPVALMPSDTIGFRIVPIATAKGDIVVKADEVGLTQQKLLERTRLLTNDWDGKSPDDLGTVRTIKADDILLAGENMLVQMINNNFKDSEINYAFRGLLEVATKDRDSSKIEIDTLEAIPASMQTAEQKAQLLAAKALYDKSIANIKLCEQFFAKNDTPWLQPFMQLITDRPKFEEIKDEMIDIMLLMNSGKNADGSVRFIDLASQAVIDQLLSKGIISAADKSVINDAILSYTDPVNHPYNSDLEIEKYHAILRISDKAVDPANGLTGVAEIADVYNLIETIRQKRVADWIANHPGMPLDSADAVKAISITIAEFNSIILSSSDSKMQALKALVEKDVTSPISRDQITSAMIVERLLDMGEKELIERIITVDNTHAFDQEFNHDLDDSNSVSFEVSQIGKGETDQWGMQFNHSNTIWFGQNAVRFNVSEDPITHDKHIVDAYVVSEDSSEDQRIARMHLSNMYSLEKMSLVLELENGDIIYLDKTTTPDAKTGENNEQVTMVRLGLKTASDGHTLLDPVTNGYVWKHYSESIIQNIDNSKHSGVVASAAPQDDASNKLGHDKGTLVKVVKHWEASAAELKEHSDNFEVPFDLDMDFDDKIKNPTSDHTVNFGLLTPFDKQQNVQPHRSAATIYADGRIQMDATQTIIQQPVLHLFNSLSSNHFADPKDYVVEKIYEVTVDESSNNRVGYVIVQTTDAATGQTEFREIKQSVKTISVKSTTFDANGNIIGGNSSDAFPVWAIALASVGGAGVLGGGGYLAYNKLVAKKAGRPKIKK